MICQSAKPENLFKNLAPDRHIRLFMDYDGTLADFAPNPDVVVPDDELIHLLTQLTCHPRLQIAIISGRRLDHIQTLVPIQGVWLAGTYGLEMQSPDGQKIHVLDYKKVRPIIMDIKPAWEQLVSGNRDFYLEDKGWSLALHGNRGSIEEVKNIFSAAQQLATQQMTQGIFHFLGGHKFLEVCPKIATKTNALEFIQKNDPVSGSLPVYLGDDDKDEIAFSAILKMGGTPILVAKQERRTQACCRLASPQVTRVWLEELLQFLSR